MNEPKPPALPGRAPAPSVSPAASDSGDDLLAELRAAVGAEDARRLREICTGRIESVVALFPEWVRSAAPGAAGSPAFHAWWNDLYVISKFVDDNLGGRHGLFGRLVARGETNPFARWERRLDESIAQIGRMEYDRAAGVLADQLIDSRAWPGFGYSHMSATTHWYLSQARMAVRDRDGAVGHGERSLAVTLRIGDHPRYRHRYLKHLLQVHRYFGEPGAAAGYARRLVEFLTEMGAATGTQAMFFERQADILAAGEPLTRVVAVIVGDTYDLRDVPPEMAPGLHLIVERNRPDLLPSRQWVAEARKAFSRTGDDRLTESLLEKAAAADPYDPEPHAERGRLLMGAGRFAEAVEAFDECERLAPGWPGCRRERWMAERMAAGELPPEAQNVYFEALSVPVNDEQAPARLAALAESHPRSAFVHLRLGEALRAAEKDAEAAAALRRGTSCDADDETRTALMVNLAAVTPDAAGRRRLLEGAVHLAGDLVETERAGLMLRAREEGEETG